MTGLAASRVETPEADRSRNRSLTAQEVDGLCRRGAALRSERRYAEAIAALERAIALDPGRAEAFNSLGNCLHETGKPFEALEKYRRAIELKRDYAEAFNNMAVALVAVGRSDLGLRSYHRAVRLEPTFVVARFNLANALLKHGRHEEAIPHYRRCIELDQRSAGAHNNLGNALSELGKHPEAAEHYRKAVTVAPDYAEAHNNLGIALCKLRSYAQAEQEFRRAIALQPNFASAHNNLGIAFKEQKMLTEAETSLRAALAAKPDYPEALSNLGQVLKLRGRHEEAIAFSLRAVNLDPGSATAHYNLGGCLKYALRWPEAEASFRRAIEVRVDYPDARFDLAILLLLRGKFTEGWKEYEERWHLEYDPANRTTKKVNIDAADWAGEPLEGKTVLIHTEQGLGDAIQFSRYVPEVARRGGKIIFLVPRALQKLMGPFRDIAEVTSTIDRRCKVDYRCSLMSLPRIFGTDFERVLPPPPTPIVADAERVKKWAKYIGRDGFKIGICWQGNPGARIDEGRSIPLTSFSALARIPGVRLVSLQKDHGLEQIQNLPPGVKLELLGKSFDAGRDAFIDSAAVMRCLDLVVTSDTSIAHLAGSLGVKTWLALGTLSDWRWQLDRTDTPWYPSIRLFRQKTHGDWEPVSAEMAQTLRDMQLMQNSKGASAKSPGPVVPLSWGELIDKVTILEIKSERLKASRALENVRHELAILARLLPRTRSKKWAALKAELREINEKLWAVEDGIREKESRQEFDSEFVDLARSVYRWNDKRAQVKRTLNDLLGSELIEEKQYASY